MVRLNCIFLFFFFNRNVSSLAIKMQNIYCQIPNALQKSIDIVCSESQLRKYGILSKAFSLRVLKEGKRDLYVLSCT